MCGTLMMSLKLTRKSGVIVRDIPENLHIYWSFEYIEEVCRVMCVEAFADVA